MSLDYITTIEISTIIIIIITNIIIIIIEMTVAILFYYFSEIRYTFIVLLLLSHNTVEILCTVCLLAEGFSKLASIISDIGITRLIGDKR